ncbi:MAG: pathogenicity island protein [Pseudomonadota bacterium]
MDLEVKPDTERSLEDIAQDLAGGGMGKRLGLGKNELETALAVANTRLNSGDPFKAFELYSMIVLCSPMEIEHQAGLANCALQIQEYTLALNAASAMVALAPKDERGYYFSAAACLGLEAYDEAFEDVVDAMSFAREAGNSEIYVAAERLHQQLAARNQ